jgi:hypothetical protein
VDQDIDIRNSNLVTWQLLYEESSDGNEEHAMIYIEDTGSIEF